MKLEFDTSLADDAYSLAAKWDGARNQTSFPEFSSADIEGWTSNQISMLLDTLHSYEPFSKEAVHAIGKAYISSNNPEIRLRWLLFALKSGFEKDAAATWVQTQGRMKYCRWVPSRYLGREERAAEPVSSRPTFKALAKVDYELAKRTFVAQSHFYHPIARGMIAKDLKLDNVE